MVQLEIANFNIDFDTHFAKHFANIANNTADKQDHLDHIKEINYLDYLDHIKNIGHFRYLDYTKLRFDHHWHYFIHIIDFNNIEHIQNP